MSARGIALLVTAVVLGGIGSSAAVAEVDRIYWTDYGTDKIQATNLAQIDVEDLVASGLTDPHGIALDMANGKMYWCDNGSERIKRANLDGSSVEHNLVTTSIPVDIALDVAAGKMYWTSCGADKVLCANLDGTDVEDLVIASSTAQLHGIALDTSAGKVYWIDRNEGAVRRANLDIPVGETASNRTDIETLITGLDTPVGLTLDVPAGKVYWTLELSKIQRGDFGGTTITNIEDLVTDIDHCFVVALDVDAGFMYWTDTGKIRKANMDIPFGKTADTRTDIQDVVTGLDLPYGMAIPEPTALVLLALGGVGLVRRRVRRDKG